MKLHLFFIFITILLVLSGCANTEKEQYNDDIEFHYEIQVLNDIFVDLTKEVTARNGFPIHPPPPKPIVGSRGKVTGYDSTLYLQRIEKYKIDTTDFVIEEKSILLAVSDSIFEIKNEEIPLKEHFPAREYSSIFKKRTYIQKPTRKVTLDSLTKTGQFYLGYSSTFRTINNDLTRYYRNVHEAGAPGVLHLSRIHFNKDKTLGILLCGYCRNGHNGHGGPVFIKKVNNKWQIDFYKMGWIS